MLLMQPAVLRGRKNLPGLGHIKKTRHLHTIRKIPIFSKKIVTVIILSRRSLKEVFPGIKRLQGSFV